MDQWKSTINIRTFYNQRVVCVDVLLALAYHVHTPDMHICELPERGQYSHLTNHYSVV